MGSFTLVQRLAFRMDLTTRFRVTGGMSRSIEGAPKVPRPQRILLSAALMLYSKCSDPSVPACRYSIPSPMQPCFFVLLAVRKEIAVLCKLLGAPWTFPCNAIPIHDMFAALRESKISSLPRRSDTDVP